MLRLPHKPSSLEGARWNKGAPGQWLQKSFLGQGERAGARSLNIAQQLLHAKICSLDALNSLYLTRYGSSKRYIIIFSVGPNSSPGHSDGVVLGVSPDFLDDAAADILLLDHAIVTKQLRNLLERLMGRLGHQEEGKDTCSDTEQSKEQIGAPSQLNDHLRYADTDNEIGQPDHGSRSTNALGTFGVREDFGRQRPGKRAVTKKAPSQHVGIMSRRAVIYLRSRVAKNVDICRMCQELWPTIENPAQLTDEGDTEPAHCRVLIPRRAELADNTSHDQVGNSHRKTATNSELSATNLV